MTGIYIILIGFSFVLGGALVMQICTSTMDRERKFQSEQKT